MILFMGLPDGSLHTAQMIRQQVLICMKEMRAVHSYKTIGTDLTTLRRKPAVRAIDHLCVHSGEVPFLSFPLMDEQDWLMNCFSTRLGGVSEEGLAALNLSYTREKGGREKVDENFRRMAESAGFPAEDMVLSWQTHTTNIRVVREEDRGKGFTSQRDYCDIDGLVTDVPGLVLVTFYGDCVPLLAADPVRHVIGAAHSGWKGTLNNIGGELIRTMKETYGCDPADVIAAIGPSICSDCFEVDRDVADAFRAKTDPDVFEKICRTASDPEKRKAGKHHIDLQEACRQNFLHAGLAFDRISVPDVCSCCNSDLLFSHRGSPEEHGLMAAFLGILQRK